MQEFKLGKLNGRFVVSWWGDDGKRKRFRLDALSLGAAKAEAVDTFREKTAKDRPKQTVKTLWEAYRTEKIGRRVVVAMEHEWKAMAATFEHLRPDQVSIDVCRSYVADRRKAGKKDGTIWTELGHLRTVLLWAVQRQMIAHAPSIERPAKPAPRERHLTRAECQRLLDAPMAAHIKLAITLLLSTAARVGAILDLTWERVDLERGIIRLRREDISTRKGRATVPMNDGLKAALSAARSAALTEYVIEWAGQQVASINTGFRAAVKAAKLEKVTPHVLRHTCAVHLAEGGVSMDEIAQYLGHEDSRITSKVYARFSPGHLQKAANILDFSAIKEAKAG